MTKDYICTKSQAFATFFFLLDRSFFLYFFYGRIVFNFGKKTNFSIILDIIKYCLIIHSHKNLYMKWVNGNEKKEKESRNKEKKEWMGIIVLKFSKLVAARTHTHTHTNTKMSFCLDSLIKESNKLISVDWLK